MSGIVPNLSGLHRGNDPQLTLLDKNGKQLAFSDDAPGCQKDARFSHVFKEAGAYVIELRDVRSSLELHPFDGSPYYVGVFLVGAYQEILGDLHNLFGDTNAVHIRLAQNGGYEVTDLVHGDTVTEVLNYVQFRASDLLQTFRRKVADCAIFTES